MSKLSVGEFAAKIRTKYPEYKNVGDQELAEMFVKKHPVYLESVDMGAPVKKKDQSLQQGSRGGEMVSMDSSLRSQSSQDLSRPISQLEKAAPGLTGSRVSISPDFGKAGEIDRPDYVADIYKRLEQNKDKYSADWAEKRKAADTKFFSSIARVPVGLATFAGSTLDAATNFVTGEETDFFSGAPADLLNTINKEIDNSNRELFVSKGYNEEDYNKAFSELAAEGKVSEGLTKFGLASQDVFVDLFVGGRLGKLFPTVGGSSLAASRAPFVTQAVTNAAKGRAGSLVLAGSAGGSKIAELKQQQEEAGTYDQYDVFLRGASSAAIEFASEMLFHTSVDDLLANGLTKNFAKGMYESAKPMRKAITGTASEVLEQGTKEGLEEVFVDIYDNVSDAIFEGKDILTKANAYGMLDSFLLGGALGTGTSLLSYGPSSIGKASDIKARRSAIEDINSYMTDLASPDVNAIDKAVIRKAMNERLGELSLIQKRDADFYDTFSSEDQATVLAANQTIKMAELLLSKTDNKQAKQEIENSIRQAYSDKTKVENKYDPNIKVLEYAGTQVSGLPSTEQVGQTAVETQPVQEAGTKTPEASRIIQALEQDETLGAVTRGEEVIEDDANAAQERVLGLMDEVEGMDIPQQEKDSLLEVLGQKFEDIEYYDNRAAIDVETTTERRAVGAPRRVIKQKIGERASTGFPRLRNYERLNNTEVSTGQESEGQVSVLEEQANGAVDLVTYTNGTESSRKTSVAPSLLDMEYVESVLDEDGNLTGVVMRPKTAKGQEESPLRFTVNNKPELAMDIAIQAKIEQVGDITQAEFEYAYKDVVVKKITKRKVEPKQRPAKQEASKEAPKAKSTDVTTEELNKRVEEDPANADLYVAVRNAMKTLESVLPDAAILFVDSNADAAEYFKANDKSADANERGTDKGRFIQNKNTGRIEIVINTSKADDVTVYHELFHAAFFRVYAQDAKTAIDFSNRLAKILESGTAAEKAIAKRVKDHISKYKGDTEAVVSEEFLAELAGIMTSDAKSITQGMASKLANFFNKIAKAIGVDPIFKEAATTKEVVDFMNSFAKASRQGAAFEPKNKTVGRNLKTASSKETKQDGKETKRPAAGNRLFNEPLTEVKSIADKYFKGAFGTERPTFEGTRTLDKARAKRISDAFDAMKHSPNDPEVAAAYGALAKETIDQYNAFLDAGYTVEINNEEPYANSQEMIDDLRNNKRIKIFSTESGFGDTPITPKQRKENPLLATTKFKDVNGQPMLVNDLFRAVHDFYGHAELGNSFGAKGEENAWNVHARMFSPLARRAMTTETRGQNSYVNFSGVNEKIEKLREKARKLRDDGKFDEALDVAGQIYELTSFADQKVGLLPEEFSRIDGFEARSSKFDDSKRSFSKAELDELPNSKYTKEQIESMINSGTYSLMSAENPQAVNTAEDNDERTARAEKWLKKNGYGNYTKIYGVFGNKENSFLVPEMTMEDAEAFRIEFDQESVAHSDGYISKEGVNPRDRKGNKFGIDYKNPKSNNYSIIKDSEGSVISFSTDYNFKKTTDLKKEVSSRSRINRQQIKDDVDESVLWFRTKFQDRLARVIKIQEDVEAYVGGGVDLKYDFKNAEARLSGVVETAGNKTLAKAEEIVKLFSSAGLNVEQFNDLLYAMHALERNDRKRVQTTDISSSLSDLRGTFDMTPTEVANAAGLDVDTYIQIESTGNATEAELKSVLDVYGMTEREFYNTYAANKSGSGMTDIDAIDILSKYPGLNLINPLPSQLKGDLRKAVEMVYEINKETREILVSTGLESREKVDNFEMSYNNYVPLVGFAEDPEEESFIEGGTRLSVVGRTKKALGRYSRADSPFTQAIVQNVAAITRGNKNLAVQKLYNLVDDNKDDNLYKVINPAVNPKYKNAEKNGKIVKIPMTESDYLSKPKEYVPVRFDGKYRFISFADERLNTAVNGMNNQEIGVITGALKTVNGWMSAFITRYDPEFVFRNFARDIQSAVFNAMAEQELTDGLANGEKIVANVMKGVYPSFKVIVQNNRGGKPTGEYANYYNEFLEYGGQIGGFFGQGSKAVDEKVVDFFNKASKNNGNGIADMPVDAVKYLGKSIDDVNNAVENAVRLSAFIAARKAKISPEKAAELSKGLTVNFNKSGEYGQVGNAAFLFFNASIQGSMRMFRTFKPNYIETASGKKLKVTMAQKFALGLVGLGALIALFNAGTSGDDEEDGKSWYSKIPDYEKERNLILMNPFDKKGKDYFKIPLPYGYNLFYILGNTIADINLGVSTTSEGVSNILMSVIANFSPTGMPGGEDLNEKILNFLTPSVLRPITEISINKDFLGRPIYTEQLDFTKGPIPDSESGKKAGAVATNLAKLMNQTTGGTEFTPGKIDVNPDVLEYIFGYYSGGTGKTLTRSSKLIEKGINGELSEVKPNEIPLARVFYGSSFEGADYSQYWDRLNTIYRLRKDAEAGNITPAEAKRVDVTFRKLKETESVLRNIRKVEKALDENKSTDKDRYKELDKKKGEYIKGFFSIYDKNNIDDI
jgi:hypothetical protein